MATQVEQHSLRLMTTGTVYRNPSGLVTAGAPSVSTDYTWITAGASDTNTILESMVLVNGASTGTTTITVKLWNADTNLLQSKAYTLSAGESVFLAEFMNMVLDGHDSTPDKITVAASVITTVYCNASAVKIG